MTTLFLDCEWADTLASQLVSLALVSADGAHRFYAERAPLPDQPTDFVRAAVYPQLLHGDAAMTERDLTRALRAFLSGLGAPVVLYDHPNDGALFLFALDGFDLQEDLGPRPVVEQRLERDAAVRAQVEYYFATHPAEAKRRHNAAVDAEALRWAYVSAGWVNT